MTPKELILLLKQQHQGLRTDFSAAVNASSEANRTDAQQILLALNVAETALVEHMQTENTLFYADYLEKKMQRGESVEKTKYFVHEMDEIGARANDFFERYRSAEAILENQLTFRKELTDIFSTLKIRMEVEEEGIFDIYLLM